jgi:tRNA threonylcarbamoyl adenosine modification protein (Sua5/YciO/YrdC/YwlC family)
MAADYVYISNSAYRILKKVWPGPYTILLTSAKSLPRQLKDKRKVIGIRIPKSPLLHAVIESLGQPLASTSIPRMTGAQHKTLDEGDDADEEGDDGEPAKLGYEIFDQFGHALDMVIDLGQELPGQESTIVDLSGEVPKVIRHGAGDVSPFDLS